VIDEAVTTGISLYDGVAAWMGGAMAEPAYGTATTTEISERTSELVLPSIGSSEAPSPKVAPERNAGLSDPAASSPQTEPRTSGSLSAKGGAPQPLAREPRSDSERSATELFETQRGVALPGDRGPRAQPSQAQRPSFWRRIALGGRKADESEVVTRKSAATSSPANIGAIENRIVEPLLQSLVSIEAKLERSHVDLTQRSDQVEQRLTQLWDIEEQLGTLNELQEALLHVSEQQRRLASSVESQTRTLRWLVGSIFFSLAAAAFVVAAVLR
jgi:hypothetical protein